MSGPSIYREFILCYRNGERLPSSSWVRVLEQEGGCAAKHGRRRRGERSSGGAPGDRRRCLPLHWASCGRERRGSGRRLRDRWRRSTVRSEAQRRRRCTPFRPAHGQHHHDQLLAPLAAPGGAADEEEGPRPGEPEHRVPALQSPQWVGCVAGPVVSLRHHQHRVLLRVPEH